MPREDGYKNLVPMDQRSKDEARSLGQHGGVASGEARRRKRTLKAATKALLETPVKSKELQQKMELLGVSAEDADYMTAVAVAMVTQAMKGNVKAAAFCRDLIGENPDKKYRDAELKLAREKFEREKVDDSSKSSLADTIQGAYARRKEQEQNGGDG